MKHNWILKNARSSEEIRANAVLNANNNSNKSATAASNK
jgi:hypothetical protein